jgi:hypothetical protein
MNANAIVNLLLEADAASGFSPNDKFVYIFGPGLPNGGYCAKDLPQAFEQFEKTGFIPAGAGTHGDLLQQLNAAGFTFIFKKGPGDIEVIGHVPIETTPEQQKRVTQLLNLEKHERVQHRDTPTSAPKELDVNYILYGKETPKATDQPAGAEEHEPVQPWEKSTMDQLAAQPAKAEKPEYGEPMAGFHPVPLTIGISFDRTVQDGLYVVETPPGGPAALAGIQAGDKIVGVLPFMAMDGKRPGYHIHTLEHLHNILNVIKPEQALTFVVHRGDKPLHIPLKPRPVQALVQAPATVAQATGQPPTPPRAERRRQWRERWQPNEAPPVRQSGNQPPNPSTLT